MLFSCNGLRSVKAIFGDSSPYEEYKRFLEKPEINQSFMARKWLEAGREVFEDSLVLNIPTEATGYFKASAPEAHSYRFQIKAGQKLLIKAEALSNGDAALFIDLFTYEKEKWELTAYADSSLVLKHEFKNSSLCLLRVQPELLADFYYKLSIQLYPQLTNPVSGAGNKAIQSVFGDPRDGGRRKHEGIDIFAARGTPVVAPAKGIVTRLGNSGLGGNTVWMRDAQRGLSYYFAHLDQQAVAAGRSVQQGDTLGFVGNTGNAKYTAPHLHSGIYNYGAIDPLGYVSIIDNVVPKVMIDTLSLGTIFKVNSGSANGRVGPGTQFKTTHTLAKNSYVEVLGESSGWYRTNVPDRGTVYISKKLLSPAGEGEPSITTEQAVLLSRPDTLSTPVIHLDNNVPVNVIANHDRYTYVKTPDNHYGWILSDIVNSQKLRKR